MITPNRLRLIVGATSIICGSGVNPVFAVQVQMIAPGQYTRNNTVGTKAHALAPITSTPVAHPRANTGTRKIRATGKTAAVLVQLPDLVVGRLYATPNVIHSGDRVSLRVKVSNRSQMAIRGILVRFLNRQSRKVLGEKTLNLAAGGVAVSQLRTSLVGIGRVDIEAILDPNQRVAERNEKNNTAQLQLSVTPTRARTALAITASQTPTVSNHSVPRSRRLPGVSGLFQKQQDKLVASTAMAERRKNLNSRSSTPQFGDDLALHGHTRGMGSKSLRFRAFDTTTAIAAASVSGPKVVTKNSRMTARANKNSSQHMATLPTQQPALVFGSKFREQTRIGKIGRSLPGSAGPGSSPGSSNHGNGRGDGNGDPGSDNTTPPFGDLGDGIPGLTNPTGMGNPADKLVTPEQMGNYDPIGSMGNLYGGVNPSKDPRLGGHIGGGPKGGSKSGNKGGGSKSGNNNGKEKWYKYDTGKLTPMEVALVTGVGNKRAAEGAWGISARISSRGTMTIAYFYIDGWIEFTRTKGGKQTTDYYIKGHHYAGAQASAEGTGNLGSHQMLSESQKRKIDQAYLQQTYYDVTHGPAIQSEGGVIDPVRNQANGKSHSKGSQKNKGQSAGHGQSPMIAKQPGSQKPGSLLIGGGRIDNDGKFSKSIQSPQGFQVIDPKAKRGTDSNPSDAARVMPN